VASVLHTIILLLILAGGVTLTYFSAGRMRSAVQPSRVTFYLTTFIWEWILTTYVLIGVKFHKTSLREITGIPWKSVKDVFRDIGIGMLFWICSTLILAIVAHIVGFNGSGPSVRFMAPVGSAETALWILLAATAGFCEETIFRGYLQKQFIAWTSSPAVGIVLAAAIFGLAHIYQGWRAPIVIGVYGIMFGALAYYRRSTRPGMIAHAWQDSISGIALKYLPK
jgi:hypothetical protein